MPYIFSALSVLYFILSLSVSSSAGKPIYSFDLRDESPANEGLLWANEVKGKMKLRIFL